MSSSQTKTILVTGANVGLGKECARQLALRDDVDRVILGCRDEKRAKEALKELEHSTGKKGVFEILIVDVSSLASVRQAVNELEGSVIHGIVMNAGAPGGKDPAEKTEYGTSKIVSVNVLGHVLLTDLLVEKNMLVKGSSVVFSGTEASRGLPAYGFKKPSFKSGSVEEFVEICDGSFFKKDRSFEAMYGYIKLVGVLYLSSMARKFPDVRFLTISPGATTGTKYSRNFSKSKQLMFGVLMPLMKSAGKAHSLQTGAKRYVDALFEREVYKSGVFYASKKGRTTGGVVDQVKYLEFLGDEEYQDNAYKAIHQFIN